MEFMDRIWDIANWTCGKLWNTFVGSNLHKQTNKKNKQTEIENSCEFALSEKFLIVVLDSLFEFTHQ
jgi:hypothetical protein